MGTPQATGEAAPTDVGAYPLQQYAQYADSDDQTLVPAETRDQ
jgi:hypothetical protein